MNYYEEPELNELLENLTNHLFYIKAERDRYEGN